MAVLATTLYGANKSLGATIHEGCQLGRRPQKRQVSLFDLQHLSPKAISALASGKYDDEVVELVLSAAATALRVRPETSSRIA